MVRHRHTVRVREIEQALDEIAPPALAQDWDNVGLLAGDRRAPCRSVLLCIDLTPAVLGEARADRHGLVFAYHPPIFKPVSRLLADAGGTEAIVHQAIAAGIALYSSHTALDAAPGGTNDVLAALCGLKDVRPLYIPPPAQTRCKLTTFVPQPQLEHVADALFAAGAGRIGQYERCSFRLRGEGTFFGTAGTAPRVGRKGRLERVPEVRLEVVAPRDRLPDIAAALRRSHPYEEPAFDLYPLIDEPAPGIGRVGTLPPGTTLGSLTRRLVRATRSRIAMTVGDPRTPIRTAAVGAGAAGRWLLDPPRAADCDVVVTGELRHHDALALARTGRTAVALGHWESERPALATLARRLAASLPNLRATVSRRDTPPGRACPIR